MPQIMGNDPQVSPDTDKYRNPGTETGFGEGKPAWIDGYDRSRPHVSPFS